MSRRRIGLTEDDFATAFPFGFVVDAGGALTVIGDALHRSLGVHRGQNVDDCFEVVRPMRVERFLDLSVDPRATVLLRAKDGEIELKGCTTSIDDDTRVAFFASAVVRDIDEFRERGLQLGDFPPSDATPDLLLSMQATRTALEDARKMSQDLKAALTDAQAATQAKARFLAVMSHEIRTPLNGFGSMIDLLRDSELDESQVENLDTMDRCTRSLMVLVNDILDFSRLEAGRVEITRSAIEVHASFARICEHFRAAANEGNTDLQLQVELPPDTWVEMDFERVRQVLANLLGNALKFSHGGSVRLQVSAPQNDRLRADVVDTGTGIPADYHQQLFAPFVQADTSSTRQHGGSGLGLTIARQIARAMGGDVLLVRSDHGGTHFRAEFDAPFVAAPTQENEVAADAAETCTFAGARVLVAEDDRTNQQIAQRMLDKLGIETVVVDDGDTAVEVASRESFDLILMDVMMPKVSGIDATRLIRDGDGPCHSIPIIAFSAAAFRDERDSAVAAGMSGFLEKPARLASLRLMLMKHLCDGGKKCMPGPDVAS